jgi:hypothetical protein
MKRFITLAILIVAAYGCGNEGDTDIEMSSCGNRSGG